MSIRRNKRTYLNGPGNIALHCGIIIFMLLASLCSAQSESAARISLNSFYEADLGSMDMLRVQYTGGSEGQQFGGFDLLIQFDSAIVTPLYAQMGGLLYLMEWEYFDYAIDSNGSIRLVAVADIANGNQHPWGYLDHEQGEIAYVIFQIKDDSSQINQYFDIKFFWEDCGNNAFASRDGDSVFLSREVYLWDSQEPFTGGDSLPTFEGAPDSCLTLGGGDSKARSVDYYGSYIHIYEPRYLRGDINVNDIAYELEDYRNFIAYFLFGPDVFSIHPAVQIANSDVNDNGIPLEMPDVVYLFKVMVGDTIPYPDKGPRLDQDTAILIQSLQNNIVSLDYSDSLALIVFCFDAYVAIEEYYQSGIWIDFCDDEDSIIYALHSSPDQKKIGRSPIFRYSGDGHLKWAKACDYDNMAVIPVEVSVVDSIDVVCGDVSGDGFVNINDPVWIINHIFGGGYWDVPCPLESSDVNCSGAVNISDAVIIINYIFSNGNAPCDVDGDGNLDC